MKAALTFASAAALLCLLGQGCSGEDAAKARDGFTGKTAVTQGEMMKKKIQQADSLIQQRSKELSDIE
jgi:hypothetical protein